MKYFLVIFFPYLSFAQDIQIRIPNEKPFVIKQLEHNKLCFTIENSSAKKYALVFDQNGFNSISSEVVDPPFLGLPFFRIYKGQAKLKGQSGSSPYNLLPNESIKEDDLERYRKKSNIKFSNLADLRVSYYINKRIILLEPSEMKRVCMNISLPIYSSDADSGSLFYDLHEGEEYFFQMFLRIPDSVLKKYVSKSHKIFNDYTLFSGSIESDKIPFIYE